MPHIICTGVTDIRPVHAQFVPSRYDSNGWLIKTMKCSSIRRDATSSSRLWLYSRVFPNFYVLVEHKENSLTIRTDQHTNWRRTKV